MNLHCGSHSQVTISHHARIFSLLEGSKNLKDEDHKWSCPSVPCSFQCTSMHHLWLQNTSLRVGKLCRTLLDHHQPCRLCRCSWEPRLCECGIGSNTHKQPRETQMVPILHTSSWWPCGLHLQQQVILAPLEQLQPLGLTATQHWHSPEPKSRAVCE